MKKTLQILILFFLLLFNSNGFGQFGPPNNITKTLANEYDAKAFDLDNDGDLDFLISAVGGDYAIVWYENLGNNDFATMKVISYSSNAPFTFEISAADMDNDGDLDIIAAERNNGRVVMFENLGNQTFGTSISITPITAIGIESIYPGDIDNDGDIDVVYTNFINNSIGISINMGGGIFGSLGLATGISQPRAVHLADLDNDGDLDALSASSGDNKIAWYENLGAGTFSSQLILSDSVNQAGDVYAADLDNDGDIDVLSIGWNKTTWYENLGSGAFGNEKLIDVIGSGALVGNISAADFDNDGDIDVLTKSNGWYENLGNGTFGNSQSIGNINSSSTFPTSIYPIDIDNDNNIDIITHRGYVKNLGNGVFDPNTQKINDVSYSLNVIKTVDIDNDGDLDILSSESWQKNKGNGVFTTQKKYGTNVSRGDYELYDIDNDGDYDIIGGGIYLVEDLGNGFDLNAQLLINIPSFYADQKTIITTDIDTNGEMDVIFSYGTSASFGAGLTISKNQGNNTYLNQNLEQFNNTPNYIDNTSTVFLEDVDGDGDMDIIFTAFDDDEIAWCENLGGGSFTSYTSQIISTSQDGPLSIYACDLDNDGDVDILSASFNDNTIAWYENLGGANFTAQKTITTNASGANFVTAEDIDNDGDLDVFSTSENDGKIAWYENLGNGLFSNQIIINIGNAPKSLCFGDLDGDGDKELFSSNSGNRALIWYENTTPPCNSTDSITITECSTYTSPSGTLFNNTGVYKDTIPNTIGCDSILTINLIISDHAANYMYIDNGNGNYSFTNTSTGNFNQTHWAFGDGTIDSTANTNHTFTTNGFFTVILTILDSTVQGDSCTSYYLDTINVTGVVNPLPCNSGFVIYPDTTGNVTIINSATGNNLTYLWSFGDGDTSNLQNPSHTYATAGPFYLCLTIDDGNGCVDMYCDSIGKNGVIFNKAGGFTINISSPNTTGINNNIDLNSEINIYPNPTSNQLTIDTELNISEVSIIDITGKSIMTTKENTNTIDVTDLTSGIYFIKIIIDEGTITKKFVKQ